MPKDEKSEKFWKWILILIALVVLLVAVVLAMTIYLVVKTADTNFNAAQPLPPISTTTVQPSLPSWPPPSPSPTGVFSTATVAADNGICSDIGRNVLIKGGNAVDSMIAVMICIGIMDSQSTGIGGGHFMTIYNKTTKSCSVIDAREVAPKAATEDMYQNTTDGSQVGYLALGVPGQVAGLWTAYQNFGGGLPWAELIAPSVDLCEQGYPVSPDLAEAIHDNLAFILAEPSLHIFINNKTGKPYQSGEIMTRPTLGATLRQLASSKDPVQLFYNSSFTKDLVQEIQAGGGIITEEDFRDYQVKWGQQDRPVVVTRLQGTLIVCGPPPPSSAAITSAILNILDGYNITPEGQNTVDGNIETYHRLIEAMKFAYGARYSLGDMDFIPDALDVANNVTTPWYGAYIRSKILDTAQNQSYYFEEEPFSFVEDHGTAHASVVDSDGNAVSVTTTINLEFGAKVRSVSHDVIWNDEMDDFSQPNKSNYFGYAPSPNNFIVPGKRPQSSMSPLVVYNKDTGVVKLVTGAAGGSKIISAVAQILMRTLYFDETIKEAVDAPRLHDQLEPFVTLYETGFPEVYVQGLTERGQNMTLGGVNASVATGIFRDTNGTLYSNCDYRRPGGFPAGY